MPRPRNTERSVSIHMMLPEGVVSRVRDRLMSGLDGRIPYQAQAQFFARAANDLLDKLDQAEAELKLKGGPT